MNTGGVFGQYNLCNRYNGHADFQNFVQPQAPFYNHYYPRPHDGNNYYEQFSHYSEFQGYHHHATPNPTTGLQFIADVTANEYRHWNNGAIVQQSYCDPTNHAHTNYPAMVPNPVAVMGPSPFAPSVHNQTVQNMDMGHKFYEDDYQEYGDDITNHVGFNQIETNDHLNGYLQHSFDSRPEWLKRRDSCVFCRVYDGKEPNEILYRVCLFLIYIILQKLFISLLGTIK